MIEIGSSHSLSALFAQLGLSNDDKSVVDFIQRHRPLASRIPLDQAPWWSASQTEFLREAIEEDAEWSYAADELDQLLR